MGELSVALPSHQYETCKILIHMRLHTYILVISTNSLENENGVWEASSNTQMTPPHPPIAHHIADIKIVSTTSCK